MGGSLRGNNGGNRVKPYGFKMLLAFGAALLGVLVIHKLRERRIFNLLVKEKDHELSSLEHLLQKEQEYTQDMKKKNDELKANLFSLSTQKMDLERKFLEMHSTISSLRNEGNILESALQEKQTEIKLLREANVKAGEVRQEVMSLKEILKQKEAEIEDLKHRQENPVKMSGSTDKGSTMNMTLNTNTNVDDIKGENSPLVELMEGEGYNANRANGSQTTLTNRNKNENYSRTGNGSQKVVQLDGREASREDHLHTLGKPAQDIKHGRDKDVVIVDDNHENGYEFSQSDIAYSAVEGGEAEPTNTSTEVRKPQALDGDLSATNSEEYKVNVMGKVDVNNYRKENSDQKETSKGGKKLEVTTNSRKVPPRRKGKYLQVQSNGKRWKILARNRQQEKIRNLENDGAGRSRSRVGPKEHQGGQINAGVNSNTGETGVTGSNNLVEVERPVNSESQVLENRYPESYARPMETPAMTVEDDASYPTNKLSQTQELPQISGNREGSTDESLDGKTHNANKNENHSQEISEHQKQDITTFERRISTGKDTEGNDARQEDDQQEPELLDKDQETNAATEDFEKESICNLEEGTEEHRGEPEDTEI